MSSATVFLAFFVFTAIAIILWALQRERAVSAQRAEELAQRLLEAQRNDPGTAFLQREIDSLRQQLSQGLSDSARLVSESQKTVGERLDRASDVVGRVQKTLGSLEQATQQVFAVGKDISRLEDLLRAPKLRGGIGEQLLGDLLGMILPARHFHLQHAFKGGETVDAVVDLGRLVPVDAKFPLENFRRIQEAEPAERNAARRKFMQDVRRHVDAIASKYIRPDEKTFDFALMYIPAENVYYETIIKDDAAEDASLASYAFSRRVIPVSPNSIYAYLQTVSLGLRGLRVEENAVRILDSLDRLKGDFGRFREDFALVGKHLSNARLKFEDSERKLARLEDKLEVSGSDAPELPAAEPPRLDVR